MLVNVQVTYIKDIYIYIEREREELFQNPAILIFLIFRNTVLIDFIIFNFLFENKIVCILQFILGGLFTTKFGSLKIIFLELPVLAFEILKTI